MEFFKECIDCKPPIRHPGCHSTCPYYQQARERYDKSNESKRRAQHTDNDLFEVRRKASQKPPKDKRDETGY